MSILISTINKESDMNNAWEGTIEMPVTDRSTKPRSTGLTMVIDKGMGIHRLEDLIRSSSDYIDIIKLTFGTSAFYDKEFLKEKNKIITSANIDVMPGGTFLEIAIWQKEFEKYLDRAKELGFSAIEISDGTIDMDLKIRKTWQTVPQKLLLKLEKQEKEWVFLMRMARSSKTKWRGSSLASKT
jgi:phosphosulfolactate synthase